MSKTDRTMKDYDQLSAQIISPQNQVGLIQKDYGKEGELVLQLWDNFPDDVEKPLWVEIDSLPVPLFIATFKKQQGPRAVVLFDDFDSVDKALILYGKKIYSSQTDRPIEEGEWSFLIGATLMDTTSGREGEIINYIDSEKNPMIEVTINQKIHLLPIASELIVEFNEKQRKFTMRLAEGIFEL